MKNKYIYRMGDPPLDNDSLLLQETLFHNANGYVGVRSNFEEGYEDGMQTIRGAYINGFYDFAPMKQAEKLFGLIEEKQTILNVADIQGICLKIEQEKFSIFDGQLIESERYLDMMAGITVRRVVWRSKSGKEVEICIKRMASFWQRSLFTIEYCVTALNFDGFLSFTSTHAGDVQNYCNPADPRVAGENFEHLVPVRAQLIDEISCLVTKTAQSGLSVCTLVRNVMSKECMSEQNLTGHRSIYKATAGIAKGETIVLKKYCIFSDSLRSQNCVNYAFGEMDDALSVPLETHYARQKAYLDQFWRQTSLDIDGDEELALAIRYNLYQLIQSVGKDEYSNIAAKGLSGEGYEGHYFWDTEMYIQPFFVLTNPAIAKNLIFFRYRTLEEARENARLLGHQSGALYPWRTIMGRECSGYFPSGTAAYHINGDIAYAIVLYYLATKDLNIIAQQGAEIIFETARLWIDTGNEYKGRFYINEVTGPDEYTCMVNNNYFTNVSAQYNLRWAVKFYELLKKAGKLASVAEKIGLKEEEIALFAHAADTMYLPYDETLKINPQDDSFLQKEVWDIAATPKENFPLLLHYHPLYLYRYQVCKQADTVLSHVIFEDAQSEETMRNSFLYYEKITTHDSSLSTGIFSIMASRLKMAKKAYDYFGDSAKLDLFNTHHNTKDGIHTANMGSSYMVVVYGFGGLRLKETGLYFSPSLPEKWNGYRFRICYEGSHIQVAVSRKSVEFTLLDGAAKNLFVYGKSYELNDTITVALEKEDEL